MAGVDATWVRNSPNVRHVYKVPTGGGQLAIRDFTYEYGKSHGVGWLVRLGCA